MTGSKRLSDPLCLGHDQPVGGPRLRDDPVAC